MCNDVDGVMASEKEVIIRWVKGTSGGDCFVKENMTADQVAKAVRLSR